MMRVLPILPSAALQVGKVVLTALILWLILRTVDGPAILRIFSNAQPIWLGVAVLVLLCQTVLSALRWKVTAARLGQTLPLLHAIKEYFMSQVINQALPGAVSGDAARAVRARAQAGIMVSSQAVILERLSGQIAMFITMAIAFSLTWSLPGGLDWPPSFVVHIGTGVIVGSIVLTVLTAALWQPALVGQRVSRLLRPFYAGLMSRQVLPAQILLGAAITLCNLTAFALCAKAVGVALPTAAVFALVPVILFSMLIPFTVSGWGVREGSSAILLPLAGIAAPEAFAASVMFGFAMILAVLPGLISIGAK